MQLPSSIITAAVALGLSRLTGAVCAGKDLAIGTASTTTGKTQWKIYDTKCTVINTYAQPSTITLFYSQVFKCDFGTTNIGQYDDPKTGWAYNATADPVAESCGSDIIIRCVSLLLFLMSMRGKHYGPLDGAETNEPVTDRPKPNRALHSGDKKTTVTHCKVSFERELEPGIYIGNGVGGWNS